MLDPIGRSVSDFFRHLPAIFALDRTQSAVQIGHRSPPGFGPRKVPADPLSQRLKLLRPLLYGCCRRLRLSHCCYLSISKDSTSLSTTVGLRVLTSIRYIANLLERGTGATYLTEKDLLDLYVPINLAREFPNTYRKYKRAIISCQVSQHR